MKLILQQQRPTKGLKRAATSSQPRAAAISKQHRTTASPQHRPKAIMFPSSVISQRPAETTIIYVSSISLRSTAANSWRPQQQSSNAKYLFYIVNTIL